MKLTGSGLENAVNRPHILIMEQFNYDAPAEVFTQTGRSARNSKVEYRRFDTGREAIRHVMEALPAEKLKSTVIETEDERYDAEAIRTLYGDPAYAGAAGASAS